MGKMVYYILGKFDQWEWFDGYCMYWCGCFVIFVCEYVVYDLWYSVVEFCLVGEEGCRFCFGKIKCMVRWFIYIGVWIFSFSCIYWVDKNEWFNWWYVKNVLNFGCCIKGELE